VATVVQLAIGGAASAATTGNKCCGRAHRPLGAAWSLITDVPLLKASRLLWADTPPLRGALVPQGGRTTRRHCWEQTNRRWEWLWSLSWADLLHVGSTTLPWSGRTAPVSIWGAGSGHAAAAQQLAGYSALQGTARGNCNGTMPIEPKW